MRGLCSFAEMRKLTCHRTFGCRGGILTFLVLLVFQGQVLAQNDISLKEEYNQKAIEAVYARDFDSAVQYFSRVIELSPNDSIAYLDRAMAKEWKGDLSGAIEDFTRQAEIDPEAADAYFLRGIVFEKLEEYPKAIADFSKVVELDDGNADAHFFRGRCRDALGEWESAIKDCSDAIRVNPEHAGAYILRGWILIRTGKLEEGVADEDSALSFGIALPDAYLHRAWAKAELGKYQEALADYIEAFSYEPEERVYPVLPKMKHSMRKIRKCLNKMGAFPETESPGLLKGILYHYLGDDKHAIDFLDQAINEENAGAEGYYFRSLSRAKLGRTAAALEDATRAVELTPKETYYFHRGTLELSMGRCDKACKDYAAFRRLSSEWKSGPLTEHCGAGR